MKEVLPTGSMWNNINYIPSTLSLYLISFSHSQEDFNSWFSSGTHTCLTLWVRYAFRFSSFGYQIIMKHFLMFNTQTKLPFLRIKWIHIFLRKLIQIFIPGLWVVVRYCFPPVHILSTNPNFIVLKLYFSRKRKRQPQGEGQRENGSPPNKSSFPRPVKSTESSVAIRNKFHVLEQTTTPIEGTSHQGNVLILQHKDTFCGKTGNKDCPLWKRMQRIIRS